MFKRILLIYPHKVKPGEVIRPPYLGLEYLAANIEDIANDIKIVDMQFSNNVINTIKKFQPDLIGISWLFTSRINEIKEILKLTSQFDIYTITGGIVPTICPDDVLSDNRINAVIRGEGEETFRQFVKEGKPNNVLGISFRDEEGKIIHNLDRSRIKNLDSLPYPARHLRDKRYKYKIFYWNVAVDSLLTSRGCYFKCDFCYPAKFYRNIWRSRSPENIVNEIKKIPAKLIFIWDDNFTADMVRVEEICDLLIKEGISKLYAIQARADAFSNHPQIVSKMSKAGFAGVLLGIESPSIAQLDKWHKHQNIKDVKEAIKISHKHKIIVSSSFMVGDLNETEEDITKIYRFAKEINVDFLNIFPLTPFPGTDKYEELKNKGLLITTDWQRFFYTHIVRTPITPERFELLRTNYVKQYNSLLHRIKLFWFFRSRAIQMLKTLLRIKSHAKKRTYRKYNGLKYDGKQS